MVKKQKSNKSRRGRSGRSQGIGRGRATLISGRHFSSGGVVFRKEKDSTVWLVTKSSTSEEFPEAVWRLPKGMLDDEGEGFSPGPMARGEKKATEEVLRETAEREVEEEGGVKAQIVSKVITAKYFITLSGKKYLKFVTFYLMKYKEETQGGFGFETSEVSWLPFEEARSTLTYEGERIVLDKAKELLDRGTS